MRNTFKIAFSSLLIIFSNILFPVLIMFAFGGAVNASAVTATTTTTIDLSTLAGVGRLNRAIVEFVHFVCVAALIISAISSFSFVKFINILKNDISLIADINSNKVVFGDKINCELSVEKIKVAYLRI